MDARRRRRVADSCHKFALTSWNHGPCAGITGTVELEILVGIDGKPIDVLIVRSSGNRALDQAARKVVLQRWAFQPAMENGQAVQARGRVPIEFKLDRQ